MKILSCMLFLLFFWLQATENVDPDSLSDRLNLLPEMERIILLNQLAENDMKINPSRSLQYANDALGYALEVKIDSLSAKTEKILGNINFYLGDFPEAHDHYTRALEFYQKADDIAGIASVLNNIGLILQKQNKSEEALVHFLKSLELERIRKDEKGIALSINNIGNLYYDQKKYQQAEEYFLQAIAIFENLNDKEGLSLALNNLGIIHDENKRYDAALDYYLQSLQIDRERGDSTGIAETSNNIGLVYSNLNIPDKALEYLLLSLAISENMGAKYGIANTTLNIGNLYLSLEQYQEAYDYLDRGLNLSREIGASDLLMTANLFMARYYAAVNDYQKAYEYHQSYVREQKKIYDMILTGSVSGVYTQSEKNRKDLEISRLKSSRQFICYIFFILLLLLLVALVLIIYSRYRIKLNYISHMEQVNRQLQELVRTDPLTDLSNRRAMLEKIAYEKLRSERSDKTFVLVMADIDDFKFINDQYGHDCGDYVLQEISLLMVNNSRRQDVIGRWGGEEFLLMLPETNLSGGVVMAEKLRKAIADRDFFYKGRNIYLTVTFGVSESDAKKDITATIREADEAMYLGKRNGKNQVTVYRKK
ncbi:MAG: GGDEF domain-containing protein [Candidatus Cloacimonetes bacterium]|nr:GGDEF domain-containing protein [Candidatus Cloacimonadota bacterium]